MYRTFTSFIVLCLLMIAIPFGNIYAGDMHKQYTKAEQKKWEFRIDYSASPEIIVSNFPESHRDVPLHENDDYLSHSEFMTNPMPDAKLTTGRIGNFSIGALYVPSKNYAIGFLWGLHSSEIAEVDDFGRRYQQNQYGTPERGIGTSLRFYQPDANDITQIKAIAEIRTDWYKPFNKVWFRLSCGGAYDITGFSIGTKGGWDRWNSDHYWKEQSFARLHEHRITSSIHIGICGDPDGIIKEKLHGIISIILNFYWPIYHLDLSEPVHIEPLNKKWFSFSLQISV